MFFSPHSRLKERYLLEAPNTYMLPWIAPADESNEQTVEGATAALEFIQKWTEASHPSKNYAASFELDKCDPAYKIDWYPISNHYELSEEMAKSIDFATEEIKKQYLSSNWNKDLPSVANSGISLDNDVKDFKDLNKRFTKALQSRSRETASDIDKTLKSSGVTGVSVKWVSPATCQSMFLQELPPRMTSRGELRGYEQWLQQRLLLARQASVSHQTEVTSAAPESKMPNIGSLNIGDKGDKGMTAWYG